MFTVSNQVMITSKIQAYFINSDMNFVPVHVFKKDDEHYSVVAKHNLTPTYAVWNYNEHLDMCYTGSYDLKYKQALEEAISRI